MIWNRSRWVRSASDSRKRKYVENPRSEWIIHDRPDLRIVAQATFETVQARFAERAELFGGGRGGRATYLLSGLLRCAVCGGAYVIAAHRPVRYGCSTHRQAGVSGCDNRLLVGSDLAETKILERVSQDLLSPAAVTHALETMRKLATADATAPAPELEKLDAQIAELERLRSVGVLSHDIAGAALSRAYRERDKAVRPSKAIDPLFGAESEYRETVEAMRGAIAGEDIPVARDALRSLLAPIRLHPRGDHLAAELQAGLVALAVNWNGSGGRIRTYDLRVMSPTSYQTAPPRTGKRRGMIPAPPRSRKATYG